MRPAFSPTTMGISPIGPLSTVLEQCPEDPLVPPRTPRHPQEERHLRRALRKCGRAGVGSTLLSPGRCFRRRVILAHGNSPATAPPARRDALGAQPGPSRDHLRGTPRLHPGRPSPAPKIQTPGVVSPGVVSGFHNDYLRLRPHLIGMGVEDALTSWKRFRLAATASIVHSTSLVLFAPSPPMPQTWFIPASDWLWYSLAWHNRY